MLAQRAHETIVVDYDCPEGTGDWVKAHHPKVTVVRASDPMGFSLSRARNLGIAAATAEWICVVDADSLLRPGWLDWLDAHLPDIAYSTIAEYSKQRESAGILVARRSDFLLAGRYDEVIRGWGGEDLDLVSRIRALGVSWVGFPNALVGVISHGDDLRVAGTGFSIQHLKYRTKLYLRAKEGVSARFGELEICCRGELMAKIMAHVERHAADGEPALYPFRFVRFCASCAARLGTNYELVLHRRRRIPFGPRRTVVLRPRNPNYQFR